MSCHHLVLFDNDGIIYHLLPSIDPAVAETRPATTTTSFGSSPSFLVGI
jgi:hypothetical protein